MKKIYLLIVSLFLVLGLQAQLSKTIENTAGNLKTLLSSTELATVTDLTVTGTMDARDFRTIRDNMSALENLEMSEAQIISYEGDKGTSETTQIYEADVLPPEAFLIYRYGQPFLKSVQIPLTTKAIGSYAFQGCINLTSFTIPSSVTVVHEYAFDGCYNMTSVTIPESVETIGSSAFKSCEALTSVILPSKVDSIQPSTFASCGALTSINIPSGVTYIGDQAFMYCRSLESITLPSSLKNIGTTAFFFCKALKSITLPESITSIGQGAFADCISLEGSVTLPHGLSAIKNETFANCSSLTSVEIPSSVDSIGFAAFLRCTSLEAITLPSSIVYIGNSAFSLCSSLSGSLTLPSSLKTIGYKAFESCSSLTGELIIPPKLTIIPKQAFTECRNLTSLVLPSSVTSIEFEAFSYCSGLTSIEVHHLFPLSLHAGQGVFLDVDKSATTLHVPFGTKERYASAYGWEDFENIVEDTKGFILNATSVDFEAEGGRDNSIEVKADFAWTAISDQSWLTVSPSSGENSQILEITAVANTTLSSREGTVTLNAEGIPSQTIQVTQRSNTRVLSITPGNLSKALGDEEKQSISALTLTGSMDARDFHTIRYQMPMLEVLDISGATIEAYMDTTYGNHISHAANTIPFAIHEWSDVIQTSYSLSEHPKLSVVKLPASLTAIGYRAFYNCPNLTTVEMQSAVERIGEEAFYFCSSLTSINLSPTVNHIGDKAFHFCSSLSSIELPPALTVINSFTFAECTSLRSVKIPESVTEIKDLAFYGCTGLKTVVMSPYVTHIQFGAFKDCGSLSSVTIPKSVIYMSSQVFLGCKNLKSIYAYSERPVVIGAKDISSVFDYVDKSSCILYVPYGTKELYANQYGWKDFLNIVEMAEFTLSPASLILEPAQTTVAVELTTALEWTVSSTHSWLRVTPASGSGNETFSLTVEANPTVDQRIARVLFTTEAGNPPYVTITQKGKPVAIEVTAGNLSAAFPNAEQRRVNNLTLTGTMDARDFKFIRDQLPLLTELNLSEVTIVAYSGNEGTYHTAYYEEKFYAYPANEIPPSAFEGYSTDIKIDFPSNVNSIGARTFYGCSKLTELTIPSSITFIGASAFEGCYNLTTIDLPSSLTKIENYLFKSCSELTSITIPQTVTSIGAYAFSSCLKLTILEIPNSVTSIGRNAFEICYDLQTVILSASLDSIKRSTFYSSGIATIRIPASVKYIDSGAFVACHNLTELYADPVNPPDLSAEIVFNIGDQLRCTLYVPAGSKEKYAAAPQWKDFFRIVEKAEFELSYDELTVGASPSVQSIEITTQRAWTAVCDKDWLTVSPVSGKSSQTITLTTLENTAYTRRTSIITFTADNGYSQTVNVIQHPRTNSIPVAHAGEDQRVEEDETVQLDGSGSTDADKDPLTYLWSAPVGITLSSVSDAKPTFTAPTVDQDTPYTFKLVVKDGKQTSVSDRVIITVTNKPTYLSLSHDDLTFESKAGTAEITITTNAQWTVISDHSWLTVSSDKGTGDHKLTVAVTANAEFKTRNATVTVSAPGTDAKTIAITQRGIATEVAELAQNRPSMSCYPNPFTEKITVEIVNPKQDKMAVDIYNLAGQRVRNLTLNNRAEKITLSWNGKNEQGKQVAPGIYICKMNGQTKQVVYQGK